MSLSWPMQSHLSIKYCNYYRNQPKVTCDNLTGQLRQMSQCLTVSKSQSESQYCPVDAVRHCALATHQSDLCIDEWTHAHVCTEVYNETFTKNRAQALMM